MLRLVTNLSAEYQGSIVPMRPGNTVIQGTRADPGLPGEPPGRHRRQGRTLPLRESPPDRRAVHLDRLEHVKDPRNQADGDRLMAESLRRRDHPEEFRDVLGRPGRRPGGRPDQSPRPDGLSSGPPLRGCHDPALTVKTTRNSL